MTRKVRPNNGCAGSRTITSAPDDSSDSREGIFRCTLARWHELPRGRRAPLFRRDRGRCLRPVRLCLNPPEATDVTVAAQKALSAVHRLGGRFGRGRMVDHLLGKIKDALDSETQLSTFGIGREYSAAGWRDLLDQLQFEGLLPGDHNDGRPLIGLGEADGVKAVYRGERRVSMRQMTAGGEPAGRKRARKRHGGERAGVEA